MRAKRWRTSPNGCIRFNRDFTRIGVGRITTSSRTRDPAEFQHRNHILTRLANDAQLDVLRGLKDGRISIEQLVEMERQNRLRSSDLFALVVLSKNLWATRDAVIPALNCSSATKNRYLVSLTALESRAVRFLGPSATLGDLAKVPWAELQGEWKRSSADWNHLRRAVSTLLSSALGDKFHPYRRSVMQRFPRAAERGRIPDLTPELFKTILDGVADFAKPCYVTLVATGMRASEYLRCTRFSLKRQTHSIEVPGTKTVASAATIAVDPSVWDTVVAAIPCPLGPAPNEKQTVAFDPRYKRLRKIWKRACEKAEVENIRIHDLRHCTGQWSIDAGVPESKVQVALRHKTPGMTRRYTIQAETGAVAKAIADALRKAASI